MGGKDPKKARPTLLDRLLDQEPDQTAESGQRSLAGVQEILASVARDMENLLNTRSNPVEVPDSLLHLNRSMIHYGLSDFTAENPAGTVVRKVIAREIERKISLFEPRIHNVRLDVELHGQKDIQLLFRITGMLVVRPLVEPVSFDTYLDVGRHRYVIVP